MRCLFGSTVTFIISGERPTSMVSCSPSWSRIAGRCSGQALLQAITARFATQATATGDRSDGLSSYGVAHRVLLPDVRLRKSRDLNNRAEVSHQPTRRRERQMQRFKSARQAASEYRSLRQAAFRASRDLARAAAAAGSCNQVRPRAAPDQQPDNAATASI
jgi:putative transposase